MKKKLILSLLLLELALISAAQQSTISVKDLSVPASAAFTILDATPSLIQTPGAPKAFILGIAQSFQQSNGGFPQEYSAELTPFWWISPGSQSIYSVAGIRQKVKGDTAISNWSQDYFSGMKFTSLSLGFFNKDMIPDGIENSNKIFSAGFRSNILKINRKDYAGSIELLVKEWHKVAQEEMDNNIELLTEISRHPEKAALLKSNFVPVGTKAITEKINNLLVQKPLFSWDLSGAYAVYGLGDSSWTTGRIGIWTSFSSYLTIKPAESFKSQNYLSLHASLRYLHDNYGSLGNDLNGKQDFMDAGGKIMFETNEYSFGFETAARFKGSSDNVKFRTVGMITYKVSENLIVHAAFGKNFDHPGKLISLFGLNWGFGTEKLKM